MDPREQLTTDLDALSTKIQEALTELNDDKTTAERKAALSADGSDLDLWVKEANKKREELEALDRVAAQTRDADELKNFLSAPQHKMPRGIGAEAGTDDHREAVKALVAAGWDNKGGELYAPSSLGEVKMMGEETLFGPLPEDDSEAARHIKAVRASFSPDYDGIFRKFIRLCSKSQSEALALIGMEEAERKALQEGVDTEGGFLVPPQSMAELMVRRAASANIRGLATVVNTTKDAIKWPSVQAAAAPDGSVYSSGFIGTWAAETPAFTETDPAFGQFEINIRKLRVSTKLSNDFVNDADANILAFLSTNGAENMALTEDQGFLNGDGAAMQPMGLLNVPGIPTTDISGTVADTISNDITDLGSADKLLTLQYSLPDQYEGGARYLLRRATEASIRKLVDAQARYIWSAGFEGRPETLLGAPKTNSVWMPAEGTNLNKVLVYGDISTYVIAQRFGISVVVLRERFADTDEIGFIMWERAGGNLWNEDALRIGTV